MSVFGIRASGFEHDLCCRCREELQKVKERRCIEGGATTLLLLAVALSAVAALVTVKSEGEDALAPNFASSP